MRNYKSPASGGMERAFRTLKGLEILVRPIRHRIDPHVRAHVFVCLLAYYVEWHMRKALVPLLFDDEESEKNHKTKDPVAPANSTRRTEIALGRSSDDAKVILPTQ